jgi:hypothetical protein
MLIQENIIELICYYIEAYDFDEKLTLCCMDLFASVLTELKLKIVEHLYGEEFNMLIKLKKFLEESRVPGTYYTQRVNYLIK